MNKRILRDILCLVFGMVVIPAVQWGLSYLPNPVPTLNTQVGMVVVYADTANIERVGEEIAPPSYGLTIEHIESCGPDMEKVTTIKRGWLIAAASYDISYGGHKLDGYDYVRAVYCVDPPFVTAITDTFVTYRRVTR